LGFPNGYGPTSQDVLVPAFLAAYSGISPDKITLSKFPSVLQMKPNWRITYDGLAKLKFFKNFLKTITIDHAYRCTYSVGAYTSNLYYHELGDGLNYVRDNLEAAASDTNFNFLPKQEASGISISEQLTPLISLDMTWNNSLITKIEIKKTRNLSLSFANNQLMEVLSNEYIVGTGYRIKDVKFKINNKKEITSDVNLKGDFSIRNNLTIIRQLEGNINQPTTGQRILSIDISADYNLGNNFNVKFFIRRSVITPKVSISFPTANTDIGFTVMFSLAQ
jgi:cell surface protein SprA